MTPHSSRARAGLLYGLGAYLIWGVLPLYFKALPNVLPSELVAHRIVWSLLFLALLAALWGRWGRIGAAMRRPRTLATLTLTATLIAINWLTFIWAVANGHVLEASLGYFLNPLVNVLLGTLLLKERLSRTQLFAVVLAACGVAVLAVGAGDGLWISLTLAASFAFYGYFRKIAPVEAMEGLAVETIVLAPFAFGWILWLQATGHGSFTDDAKTTVLLVLAGIVTAVPLLWFTAAAKRLTFSTLGLLQYVGPTMQFLTAVLVFGEKLTTAHLICFGAIWSALLIYVGESLRLGRAGAQARAAAAAVDA